MGSCRVAGEPSLVPLDGPEDWWERGGREGRKRGQGGNMHTAAADLHTAQPKLRHPCKRLPSSDKDILGLALGASLHLISFTH